MSSVQNNDTTEQSALDVALDLSKTVIVAFRQGVFFGIETRIPYAITSILRPMLFNKPTRPLKTQVKFFAEQTAAHGFIIARIAVIFKLTERALAKLQNSKTPKEWHSFVAGALAGYLIMAHDSGYKDMKKQINMAIGIRTIYAVGAYLVRTKCIPFIEHTEAGYEKGTALFYTLMWGAVMWHWRHFSSAVPGEMNVAQVRQMDFIYNDFSLSEGWLDSTYIYWLAALVGARYWLK